MSETVYKKASTEDELRQILELQEKNHFGSAGKDAKDGFVTVKHTLELLTDMNNAAPHVIAKQGDKVIGYALVMLPSFGNRIPVLYSLFEMLSGILYNGKKLSEYKYYVMGQVCVAEEARGTGVFDMLYQKHKEFYSGEYELCVTEVSVRNLRSIRAHERAGFKSIHRYTDENDEWDIIALELSS